MDTDELIRKAMMRGRAQATVTFLYLWTVLIVMRLDIDTWLISHMPAWFAFVLVSAPFLLWFWLQERYFRRHPLA